LILELKNYKKKVVWSRIKFKFLIQIVNPYISYALL
jgi:hypothetical protein